MGSAVVGLAVGSSVGVAVGRSVGFSVGVGVGEKDGAFVVGGSVVGSSVGDNVGEWVGTSDGAAVGKSVVGCSVGKYVVGLKVGVVVGGAVVGSSVGAGVVGTGVVGAVVGAGVGARVQVDFGKQVEHTSAAAHPSYPLSVRSLPAEHPLPSSKHGAASAHPLGQCGFCAVLRLLLRELVRAAVLRVATAAAWLDFLQPIPHLRQQHSNAPTKFRAQCGGPFWPLM